MTIATFSLLQLRERDVAPALPLNRGRHRTCNDLVGLRSGDVAQIRDELACTDVPGACESEFATSFARYLERTQACRPQVLVENPDRAAPNHVAWPHYRKRRHWDAARKCLQLDDAECVGAAGEY